MFFFDSFLSEPWEPGSLPNHTPSSPLSALGRRRRGIGGRREPNNFVPPSPPALGWVGAGEKTHHFFFFSLSLSPPFSCARSVGLGPRFLECGFSSFSSFLRVSLSLGRGCWDGMEEITHLRSRTLFFSGLRRRNPAIYCSICCLLYGIAVRSKVLEAKYARCEVCRLCRDGPEQSRFRGIS